MNVVKKLTDSIRATDESLLPELLPTYVLEYLEDKNTNEQLVYLNLHFGVKIPTRPAKSWLNTFVNDVLPAITSAKK